MSDQQNDLEQDIRELERRGLIERCFRDGEEVVELTAMGRRFAQGLDNHGVPDHSRLESADNADRRRGRE